MAATYQKLESIEDVEGNEITTEVITRPRSSIWSRLHFAALYISNFILLFLFLPSHFIHDDCGQLDPSLKTYSPANQAVEYQEQMFNAVFFSKGNPYNGFPTNETDQLWEDLYNDLGITFITAEEASGLSMPTLAVPGTKDYLIQLDVFHELHCLNDLRKVFYPERYGWLLQELVQADGNISRNNNRFLHWEHCIDAIRQTIMCHADISPLSYHIFEPPAGAVGHLGIFPRLATKHTCRNFEKIQDWAREHTLVGGLKALLTPEEAKILAEESGFDQSTLEDAI